MNPRRLALLCLGLFALLATPVMALDDLPEDDQPAPAPIPPRPVPPAPQPPPPPPRMQPPPPPRVEPRPEPAPPRMRVRYEPSGFYFAPELLALQFDNGDLEYGTDATSGEVYSVDAGDLELGGRLGLGYRWRSHWDFVVRGTSVSASESDGAVASGPAGIATTFAAGLDTAEAEMEIDYATIDAEVGYTWGTWDRSNMRLFFGPRFAMIDQELTAVHDPDTGVAGDRWMTNEQLDMEALGLHVGLEGHIAFNRNWALILQGGFGGYQADFDDDITRTSGDGAVTTLKSSTSDDDTITSMDASLALRWQRQAFRDGMFAVRFGWEAVQWNDVPSPADFASTSGPDYREDDFTANGPFLRLEWIF